MHVRRLLQDIPTSRTIFLPSTQCIDIQQTRYGRLTSLHRLQCSLVPTLRSKSCRITLCPFFCLSAALEKSEPSTGPNVTCVWARIARSWNSKAPRCLVALLSWRYLDPNASSPASARPCPPSPPPPPPPSNAIQCIHSRSFVRSSVPSLLCPSLVFFLSFSIIPTVNVPMYRSLQYAPGP